MDNSLQKLEQYTTEKVQIPFAQCVNPENLENPLEGHPYGLFITQEQSDKANFFADDFWSPCQIKLGKSLVNGFIAQEVRFVILKQTPLIIQEKVDKSWRYCGLAYENGEKSELYKTMTNNMRIRKKYLVFFLNKNNQILHTVPLQFSLTKGSGGAFGEELRESFKEIQECYQSLTKSTKLLTQQGLAFWAHDFKFDFFLTDQNPYLTPVSRLSLMSKEKTTVARGGNQRSCTLIPTDWKKMLIDQDSTTGQAIATALIQFKTFGVFEQDKPENIEEFPF